MAFGSRSKGNRYELELCRTFSVWWMSDKSLASNKVLAKDLPFRRAPLSGGWDKKAAAADMIAMTDHAKLMPYSLEAKDRQEWDWREMMARNPGAKLLGYWRQCCEAAKAQNKTPLVVFTRKFDLDYVCMESKEAKRIGLKNTFIDTVNSLAFAKLDDLLRIPPATILAAGITAHVQGDPNELQKEPLRTAVAAVIHVARNHLDRSAWVRSIVQQSVDPKQWDYLELPTRGVAVLPTRIR